MWVDENRKAPVADFLGWLLFISVFAQIIMLILEPASVSNAETGKLTFAILCGEPNGSPWYMMPLGFLIMLPLVGFAEETGWRGFLQPMLEKRFPFPVATTIVAVIWCIWHFPIWLQPTSNHYGDSMVGFAINIFVWAFVAASIYKSTKSVLACAIYHSFINSIGAIYDWNKLFDTYPNSNAAYIYFGIILIAALVIWYKE